MIAKHLDLTKDQFKAFMAMPIDTPLQMLNLLKFKEKVEETGVSGRAQYKVYMKATTPFPKIKCEDFVLWRCQIHFDWATRIRMGQGFDCRICYQK